MKKIHRRKTIQNSPKTMSVSEVMKHVIVLQSNGQFQNSLDVLSQVRKQGINSADVFHLEALALRSIKRIEEAESSVKLAVDQKPNEPIYVNTFGVILLEAGNLEEAEKQLIRATRLDPKAFDPWNNLGSCLRKLKKYQEAENALRTASRISPKRPEPYLNMALIMAELRQWHAAVRFTDRTIELSSADIDSLRVRKCTYLNKIEKFDEIEQEVAIIDRTVLSADDESDLDLVIARTLDFRGKSKDAISILEPWMGKQIRNRHALLSQLGMYNLRSDTPTKALYLHEQLLEEDPENIVGRWNYSLCQLVNGKVSGGLRNYEIRWQWNEFPSLKRDFIVPKWNGEPIMGKRVLVWREQGIGDEIRFSSLIPDLIDLGARVTVEASDKLIPLFKAAFPKAEIVPEGPANSTTKEYAKFDFQVPMGSLALHLRKNLSEFFQKQRPWLVVDPRQASQARAKLLSRLPDRKKLVAICWRSSNQSPTRSKHYFAAEHMAALSFYTDCLFVSAQYDGKKEEFECARAAGLPLFAYVNVNQKDDLTSAATLLAACDLVVSANVSVADLACGLGVPTIRIGQKPEPIRLGQQNVPWYPTCKYLEMEPFGQNDAISQLKDKFPEYLSWADQVNKKRGLYDDSSNHSG